jgi:hypothetical protein
MDTLKVTMQADALHHCYKKISVMVNNSAFGYLHDKGVGSKYYK